MYSNNLSKAKLLKIQQKLQSALLSNALFCFYRGRRSLRGDIVYARAAKLVVMGDKFAKIANSAILKLNALLNYLYEADRLQSQFVFYPLYLVSDIGGHFYAQFK